VSKSFFEVFPTLSLHEKMKHMLSETEVLKVSANRSKTSIRIYLFGTRLISKEDIFSLEKEIAKQLFDKQKIQVKIIEKFQLSGQYTAKRLMQAYQDSIVLELRSYSLLLYNVYRSAQITFEDEKSMNLVLDDSMIAKERSEELVSILEKIFCERCGMDLIVNLSYRQKEGISKIKNADLKMEQEIKNVIRMLGATEDEYVSGNDAKTKQEQTKRPAEKKQPQRKAAERKVRQSGCNLWAQF
jgi:DNA polymerase-3 subunit alpha (Gram-positive type)